MTTDGAVHGSTCSERDEYRLVAQLRGTILKCRQVNMRLVVIPGCRLIGLYFEASWNELSLEAHRAWDYLFSRSRDIPKQIGDQFIRVSLWENDGLHGEFVGSTVASAVPVPKGLRSLGIHPAKFVYEPCAGTEMAVRETFGTMYAWAQQRALRTDEYRIDSGYRAPSDLSIVARQHELYVRLSEMRSAHSSVLPTSVLPTAA